MSDYEKCMKQWNEIFKKESISVPGTKDTGIEDLNSALDWLTEGTSSVLDFGCGNGSMLFYCAKRGTRRHIGIDLSEEGIKHADARKEQMPCGTYEFIQGGVDCLELIDDNSFGGIILSNIIDNLYPEDAKELLNQCQRILRPQGKLMIKVNPFVSDKQRKEWNIRVIEGNLLDDGMLLWNLSTKEWKALFNEYVQVEACKKVYYPKADQTNRLFLCVKPE